MQLDFSLIRDLAEMRILFGKIMITLAAERMNAESLCALEAILEQIRGAGPTERQSGDLDFAWYHQLALATQNGFSCSFSILFGSHAQGDQHLFPGGE
jgi:DNA-binding FadR family transcriptional regulator